MLFRSIIRSMASRNNIMRLCKMFRTTTLRIRRKCRTATAITVAIAPVPVLAAACAKPKAKDKPQLACVRHPGAYRVAKPLMPLLFELRPVGSVMGLQAAPLHSPFKPLAPASEPGDRVHYFSSYVVIPDSVPGSVFTIRLCCEK